MRATARPDRSCFLFSFATAATFVAACAFTGGDDNILRADKQLFRVVTVASGIEKPWGLAFLPDGEMLVTERAGQLRWVADDGKLSAPINGVPEVAEIQQGGLLDVALHPEFSLDDNPLVYLSYSAEENGRYGTEVARGYLDRENLSLSNVEVIFVALPKSKGGRHFGSRLLFDNDGYLYITLGDRGYRPNGQDLSTHPGSVVRLRDDGSVPEDNPFVGRDDTRPEIWSYGHRNPQGMTIDRKSGRIWVNEHGPQGGDELNLIQRGSNYGWADVTYGGEYGSGAAVGEGTEKAGTVQPIFYWDPSIAPSGLAYYDSDQFSAWRGSLLTGALKFQLVTRLPLDGDAVHEEERILENELGRIRDVRQGPDGFVYLLNDHRNGSITRLEPLP